MEQKNRILILDFGGQTTQLIARRIREQRVYCEIFPFNAELPRIEAFAPKGIVLSGGPASVGEAEAPDLDPRILELGVPVLGICYGLQIMTKVLGGKIESSGRREFGRAELVVDEPTELFAGLAGGRSRSGCRTGIVSTSQHPAFARWPTAAARPSPPWPISSGGFTASCFIRRWCTRPAGRRSSTTS